MYDLTNILEIFARGGGGGSGGKAGGALALFVSYTPIYYLTKFLKKIDLAMAMVVGLLLGVIWGSILAYLIAKVDIAIGKDSFLIFLDTLTMFSLALLGHFASYYDARDRFWRNIKKTKSYVEHASELDPTWDTNSLLERVSEVFYQYQRDWSTFNTESIRQYTTERYGAHVELMLRAMKEIGRENVVANPTIKHMELTGANDSDNDLEDSFSAGIEANANDQLIEVSSGKRLFVDNATFTENWTFKRRGGVWLLDSIEQATADIKKKRDSLVEFANSHNMFYSLDWGWLLLPKRGALFKHSSFGRSDINNHVIGLHGDILIQFYTYVQLNPRDTHGTYDYVIAQATLPKSYGRIFVRPRGMFEWLRRPPKDLFEVRLEGVEFGKHFRVFANDMDRVNSLELLHPHYMEKLIRKGTKMGIEIVDNNLYIYNRRLRNARNISYEVMLELLNDAFDEMKM